MGSPPTVDRKSSVELSASFPLSRLTARSKVSCPVGIADSSPASAASSVAWAPTGPLEFPPCPLQFALRPL